LTLIQSLSPGDSGRQIANTHTIFAIFAVLVLLPFSDYIVKLSQKIIPQRADEVRVMEEKKLHYMTKMKNIPSSIVVTQTKQEISRMGKIAYDNLKLSIEYFFDHDEEKAQKVLANEEVVNYLDDAIVASLSQLHTANDLFKKDIDKLYHLTIAVVDFERISDHATNIVEHEVELRKHKAELSAVAVRDLKDLSQKCLDSVSACLHIFDTDDYEHLEEAKRLEDIVDETHRNVVDAHVERLKTAACNPLSNVVFSDLATDLERCSDHAINIAFALAQTKESDV
jgi:phosphate:Na+ symporter